MACNLVDNDNDNNNDGVLTVRIAGYFRMVEIFLFSVL